ncbi:MAG: hypothetical protein S4CHLAM81_11640 [Chlamydiales bacterium]|nr:hypothetical protein [Chlamydiales bacterium]MCH9635940.1 hypothetical protein [Chlamydiales bacterium]MCH9703615.1 hypothetical protein [Chlamydiota bacterium]
MPIHAAKYILPLLFLLGCEKKSEGEYIYRHSQDRLFAASSSQVEAQPTYPWQSTSDLPTITKEFFRCKGNLLNPVREKKREGRESFFFSDCNGTHSLPIVDGKEFVYPILLKLLNFVQLDIGKRITVTTGHRCPTHNSYCDYTPYNYGSKHMIGAEVDFYIEDVQPEKIIESLQKCYETPFLRYTKGNLNISTEAWYNDEVFIKLYLPNEGRDEDNLHNNAYISIQVRYDSEKKQRVRFDQAISESLLRG